MPDEAAEAAEQAQQHAQALADAQDKLNQAQTALNEALQAQQDAAGTADSSDDDAASQRVAEAQAAYDAAAAELAALQPAEEPDGNTEPAADSAEEPQSEPDSANGEKRRLTHNRKPKAIPHNSKCRYGERGTADAKPKAQIILDVLSSILATQMPCRSRRSGA